MIIKYIERMMMKSLKGYLFVLLSIGLTLVAWALSGMSQFMIPGLALTTLSLTFVLSTRWKLLENWFHGIENMYTLHKFMATFSMVLLLLHNVSMGGLWGNHLAAQFGNLAIYTFLSIILVAYLGKFLPYENWRWIHRLVYLAYVFGLLHVYMILGNALISFSLLAIVVGFFAILGLVAGFYVIFLYQTIAFKHLGKVTAVKHLNHDTTEIEIQLSQPLDYDYGQFAFLKIFQEGFERAPHPFSISGGSDKTVYFTTKASGDYTKNIYDNLKVGSKVTVDRAYGHMHLNQGHDKQVWIAGGIGITPFISYLRENPVLDKQVDFYYAYTGQENAVYLDLLRDYAAKNPNLTLHIVDSQKDGFLNFDNYPLTDDTTVFMCGPVKMMTSFAKTFKKINPKAELVYEGFSFR